MKYRLFFSFSFLFLFVVIYSQEPFFKTFSSSEGLSTNTIYNVIEDHEDLIWVGTELGLYYYNGRKFNHIVNHSNTKSIFNLQIDKDGVIWCSDYFGNIFYIVDKELVLFKSLKDTFNGSFTHLLVFNKELFIFSDNKGYKIDKISKEVKSLPYGCKYIAFFNKAFIFIDNVSKDKIISLEQVGDEVITKEIPLGNKFDSSRKEEIQLFQWNESIVLKEFDNDEYVILNIDESKIAYPSDIPSDFTEDIIFKTLKIKDSNWFFTSNGIEHYKHTEDGYNRIRAKLFEGYQVTDVLKDHDDNYWIATFNNGLIVSPSLGITKVSFGHHNRDITSLENIGEDRILIGTQDGNLIDYNSKNSTYNIIKIPYKRHINKMVFNSAYHKVYLSTNTNISYTYDINTKELKDVGFKFSAAKDFSLISKDSLVYLGYKFSLLYSDVNNSNQNIKLNDRKSSASLYNKYNKELYASYTDGLAIYNKDFEDQSLTDNYKNTVFSEFALTTNNEVWGRVDNKIYKIKNHKVVDSLWIDSDITQTELKGICADSIYLWMITTKGLLRYNTIEKNSRVIKFNYEGSNKFFSPVIQNDRMYIPGNDFLCVINLKEDGVFKDDFLPKAYVGNVIINGNKVPIQSHYTLDYKHNSIAFNFEVNGLDANKYTIFNYKLNGLDKEWQLTTIDNQSVRYANLPSGDFELLLKGQNLRGLVSEEIYKIKLRVKEPFWVSKVFITSIVLAFIGLLMLYYKLKMNLKEKSNKKKVSELMLDTQLSRLRLENLRSQMNPHFIFNSLGAIQDYMMKNEKFMANDYLVKFSRLIRMYLEHSRENKILLDKEIKSLKIYISLEQLRFEDKFKSTIKISPDVPVSEFYVPPLFFQTFIENAIKHGLNPKDGKGNLEVRMNYDKKAKVLLTEIEDDGIGRAKSYEINKKRKEHSSFAINASHERTKLYKKENTFDININFIDKFDFKQRSTGTIVSITIKKITDEGINN